MRAKRKRAERRTLFHLDVGRLYDGGPLCELVREQLAELGWRADLDLGAESGESRARLRLGKGVGGRGIEFVVDWGMGCGPGPRPRPETRLQRWVTRPRGRRHIGAFAKAFGRGDTQRAHGLW